MENQINHDSQFVSRLLVEGKKIMKLVGSFHRISNTNILGRDHVVAFIVTFFEVGWKKIMKLTHSLTMKKIPFKKKGS